MSKKNKKIEVNQDPFAAREAERYEDPIPSREFIQQFVTDAGGSASREQMVSKMDLQTEQQQEALRRRLRAMERDGQLACNRQGHYIIASSPELITGKVIAQKDSNAGYVAPEDGSPWIVLPYKQMRCVFPGDVVRARIHGLDSRGRFEGAVVDVIQRNTPSLVGRFHQELGVAYVVPEDSKIRHNIMILPGDENAAVSGQYVMVDIVVQPTSHTQPIGKIQEIFGEESTAKTAVDVAIRAFGLPYNWPDAAVRPLELVSEAIPESEKQGRIDIRHLPLVTIDGEDAKDFDDAVYAEPRVRGGWNLYVAIADVSHYVRVNSPLDKEAINRGNSVYFPNRVVPMLPEKLSNGLCSLKPRVDRLCLVSEMQVSADGKLTRHSFYPAVMHSKARLTYTAVAAMLRGENEGIVEEHLAVLPHLQALYQLYQVLLKQRVARGALDFDTVETRIVLDAQGQVTKVVPVYRNDAHRIIEECMLLANVATAKFLAKHKMPTLYRVHDGPKTDKLADLRQFFALCGIRLSSAAKPTSADLGAALLQARARPDYPVIQMMVLRSMMQASYSPENIGHFGLAYPAYAHFTSPIRRYPDLVVHRGIRYVLNKNDPAGKRYSVEELKMLGDQTSLTERRADDASRDVIASLKCSYMHGHLGEEFDGVISGIVAFGFFVQIKDLYVDGLVHVSSLRGDYYQYDSVRQILRGERSGRLFQLGDQVHVKLVRVDLSDRKIDFELLTKSPIKFPAATAGAGGKGSKKAAIRERQRQSARANPAEADTDKKPAKKAKHKRRK